jgi:hypothetical protein
LELADHLDLQVVHHSAHTLLESCKLLLHNFLHLFALVFCHQSCLFLRPA